MLILKALRNTNSVISPVDVNLVLLPVRETSAMMLLMIEGQLNFLS